MISQSTRNKCQSRNRPLIVFQHYYPEAADVMEGRKYGFNIVSQLLKLFVIFPAVSALAAWICTLF